MNPMMMMMNPMMNPMMGLGMGLMGMGVPMMGMGMNPGVMPGIPGMGMYNAMPGRFGRDMLGRGMYIFILQTFLELTARFRWSRWSWL
jgi:hypothetical protein